MARSLEHAQLMMDEALAAFAKAGLDPNLANIAWMANTYCGKLEGLVLRVGNVLVPFPW